MADFNSFLNNMYNKYDEPKKFERLDIPTKLEIEEPDYSDHNRQKEKKKKRRRKEETEFSLNKPYNRDW